MVYQCKKTLQQEGRKEQGGKSKTTRNQFLMLNHLSNDKLQWKQAALTPGLTRIKQIV